MKKTTFLKAITLSLFSVSLVFSSGCKKEESSNEKPVVSNVLITPSSVLPGGTATVNVSASDANDDELTYVYNASGGTIMGNGSTATWTAPDSDGSYTVTVTVSDGKGETTGTGSVSVEAPSNSDPVINSVQVNPSSVNAGGIVTVTVDASDTDGDQLTYQYQVTGGAISGSGSSVTWTAPSQIGAHSVTVTVSDGNGGQITGNGSVTVNQQVTQITGTANFPAGSSGDLTNAKVSLYTSFENWNGNNPIKYVAATGSGSNVSFSITDIPPGIYYLDVWKDNDNSAGWSIGDFVGWYGDGGLGSPTLSEISVVEGETKTVTISMMSITGSNYVMNNTKLKQ